MINSEIKKKYSIIILILLIAQQYSCNRHNSTDDSKLLDSIREDIVNILNSGNGRIIKFKPVDTIVEIGDNIRLIVYKNSFLLPDSSNYDKEVIINFNFQNNSDSIFSEIKKNTYLESSIGNVFAFIKFNAVGINGEHLILRPLNEPELHFPSYSQIYSGFAGKYTRFFQYDSSNNTYINTLIDYKSLVQLNKNPVDLQRDAIPINKELIDFSELEKRKPYSERTYADTLGYAITIKTGLFLIGWNDWSNMEETKVNIRIENLSSTIADGFVKVILLTKQEIGKNIYSKTDNMYLIGERIEGSLFSIKKPVNMYMYNSLHLPLQREYSLFVYGIKNGKYFCKTTKKIKLKNSNLVKIKIEEVSKEELLNQIKNM
jgi:hypothetical protein